MSDGQLIEFDHATKRFGAVAAVSDLSARVRPGVVTGFLGPNGAGKTTTLRMLLGLERPTSGTATIGGSRYAELRNPARVIGAMLEDPGFRARRTVERHLINAAKANSIPLSRVGELISFVGLGDDVDTRITALSLGMRQRLSAATALIGDPGVLVLDEPANGLDPEGIRWMRTLIRGLADEGRTVLVSSHVLSEVEQIADDILVIAHGELKFTGTMEDLADPRTGPVVVDAENRSALSAALKDAGYEFEILRSGLTVRGSDAATIGALTARAGVALTTLQQRGPTLEDVFLDLVHDRYVAPVAPETTETALFELPLDAPDAAVEAVEDEEVEAVEPSVVEAEEAEAVEGVEAVEAVEEERPRFDSLAQPVSAPATSSPALDDPSVSSLWGSERAGEPSRETVDESPQETEQAPQADESVQHADESPRTDPFPQDAEDSPWDAQRAEGDTERAERPEGDEAAPAASDAADERPIPGLSDLAAVASLFANPSTEPNSTAAAVESVDAQETEDEESEDDATRVIDVVPSSHEDFSENSDADSDEDSDQASAEADSDEQR